MTMTKFKISFKRRDIHMSEEVLSEPTKDENVLITKAKPLLDRLLMIISMMAAIWCIALNEYVFPQLAGERFYNILSLCLVCLNLSVLAIVFIISFKKVSDKTKNTSDLVRLICTWLAFFTPLLTIYASNSDNVLASLFNQPYFSFPYFFLLTADTILYLSSKCGPIPSNDEKMTQLSNSLALFFGGISLVTYFFIRVYIWLASYIRHAALQDLEYPVADLIEMPIFCALSMVIVCLLLMILFSKSIRNNKDFVYVLVGFFVSAFVLDVVVYCLNAYQCSVRGDSDGLILLSAIISLESLVNWTALLFIVFPYRPFFPKRKARKVRKVRKEPIYSVYWKGTPGTTFLFFLGQGLLVLLTLGIFSPWVFCSYKNWVYDRSSYGGHRYRFYGQGEELFGKCLVWGILCTFTLGIYSFWAFNSFKTWENANTFEIKEGTNPHNQQLATWNGTARDVFVFGLVNGFLIAITLGIYTPWFYCKYKNWVYEHSSYQGLKYRFIGDGGDLFGKCLVWGILSVLTLGIYSFWAFNYFKEWENRKILVAAN
jgi:hypothetical protein